MEGCLDAPHFKELKLYAGKHIDKKKEEIKNGAAG